MSRDAAGAEHVTRDPREETVVLGNLDELRPPAPRAAAIAHGGASGYALGSYDVGTVLM